MIRYTRSTPRFSACSCSGPTRTGAQETRLPSSYTALVLCGRRGSFLRLTQVEGEGTRPDDVGRERHRRVYVSQHPIEDPSPTKKRARTATDAGDMTFEAAAEPFLAAMKQGELVAAIGKAWDASPALRSALEAATADTWSRAPNQMLMLAYNWEEDPQNYGETVVRSFQGRRVRYGTVNIGNLWRGMSMDTVNDLLDGGDWYGKMKKTTRASARNAARPARHAR